MCVCVPENCSRHNVDDKYTFSKTKHKKVTYVFCMASYTVEYGNVLQGSWELIVVQN